MHASSFMAGAVASQPTVLLFFHKYLNCIGLVICMVLYDFVVLSDLVTGKNGKIRNEAKK